MNKQNENIPGYRQTQVGWLPNEWNLRSLGELGEFKNGISKGKNDFGYGYPFINLMDVFGISKTYSLSVNLGLVNTSIKERQEFSLIKGDVLFVRSSVKPEGVGLTTVIYENIPEATFSGFLIRFRDNNYFDLEYKAHCFFEDRFRRSLLNKSTISANTNINQSALSGILIPLPPLHEQKAIASILSNWDTGIEKTRQLIDQKELRKKALMRQLLAGKKRLPGFTDKWKIKELETILNPISRTVNKPKENFLALGIRSHGKGTFLKEEFEPTKIDMDTLYRVKQNDLILNITFAWEGAVAIAGPHDDGALVSHRFPTFTFNNGEGIVDYFRYVIVQPRFKYMLGLISPGGAGRNRVLSKTDFLKLELKLPNVEEQTAIAKMLMASDKELELLKQKLALLKEQKRGLMQKLLTGKKRVKMSKENEHTIL